MPALTELDIECSSYGAFIKAEVCAETLNFYRCKILKADALCRILLQRLDGLVLLFFFLPRPVPLESRFAAVLQDEPAILHPRVTLDRPQPSPFALVPVFFCPVSNRRLPAFSKSPRGVQKGTFHRVGRPISASLALAFRHDTFNPLTLTPSLCP